MSLTKRLFSFLTLALAVTVFATLTFAQETKTDDQKVEASKKSRARGFGDGLRKGGRAGKLGMHGRGFHGFRGIELTDAQKAQIKTIRENNRPDEATMKELRSIHAARKAGTAITPEQKERVKAIREQMAAKAKSVREQMLAVLTPEQKTQIETKKTEMRQRFEQRRQNRKTRTAPKTTDKPVIK